MRFRRLTTRRGKFMGIWGGVGSKGADTAFQPPMSDGAEEAPERLRRVRLRKRRRPRSPVKRLSSFNLIVLGLLAMVVGSFGFHMANEMGGRAFDTGPQGARDSGLYFFFMMAAGVVALGGAYAFVLGCLRIRQPKGPRPRDAEVFD